MLLRSGTRLILEAIKIIIRFFRTVLRTLQEGINRQLFLIVIVRQIDRVRKDQKTILLQLVQVVIPLCLLLLNYRGTLALRTTDTAAAIAMPGIIIARRQKDRRTLLLPNHLDYFVLELEELLLQLERSSDDALLHGVEARLHLVPKLFVVLLFRK